MDEQGAAKTNSVNQALTAQSEMDGKYLTFWLEKQLFGVPIQDVVQIVGMQAITEMPEFPAYMKGIISLRGSIIPLIDVRMRFGKPETEYNERTCIIVTSIRDHEVGLIVDEVDEVSQIDETQVSPPPSVSNDSHNAYLTGIAKHEGAIVLLVDTAKIWSDQGDSR